MSDDLEDLIRAAMKTLDEQVQSGYFEALPNQTLARLEGSSMQHGSSGTTDTNARDAMVPPPVEAVDRDEDSGLHDIRNLAQSTKQRLSSRRITANPIAPDDDILASASGSFKNIALPQPAAMVSLPELTDLPSKKEVEKKAKAEKKAVAVEEAVSTERAAFSLPSQQSTKSKAPLFAVLGLGVAAAAGAVIYTQVVKSDKKAAPQVAAAEPKQDMVAAPKAPEPTVAPIETQKSEEELKAEAELEKAKADALAAEQAAAAAKAEAPAPEPEKVATKAAPVAKKGHKEAVVETKKVEKTEAKPTETKKPDAKKPDAKASGGGEGEPSFDALLKEAGVDEKKDKKPVLEKKSLTADDFKKGMAAVTDKAQSCYAGTQGTATVKLTISPSGAVSKVTVGGAFAGKPEAACVAAAVKNATFPPWDGGPQSFTYAYMLSD